MSFFYQESAENDATDCGYAVPSVHGYFAISAYSQASEELKEGKVDNLIIRKERK